MTDDQLQDQEHDLLRQQRAKTLGADVMRDAEKIGMFDELLAIAERFDWICTKAVPIDFVTCIIQLHVAAGPVLDRARALQSVEGKR